MLLAVPHPDRLGARLLGRVVPRRSPAGALAALPRRGRRSPGYEWIELGPYGYLPTDPAVLTEETARRGLKVSAGTVFTGLHHGPAVWEKTWAHVADNAALAQAMGAGHLVVIPSFWRDDKTGEVLEAGHPDARAVAQPDHADRAARPRGAGAVRPADRRPPARRHPHRQRGERHPLPRRARTPTLVSLCLDTGPLRLLRRRQRQADRDLRRADRLPPPQAGRPGDPRGRTGERGAVRAGGRPRRDVRTARPGYPRWGRCWRPRRSWTWTCSRSSSRTCTRASRTSRCRSRSGPGRSCGPAGRNAPPDWRFFACGPGGGLSRSSPCPRGRRLAACAPVGQVATPAAGGRLCVTLSQMPPSCHTCLEYAGPTSHGVNR